MFRKKFTAEDVMYMVSAEETGVEYANQVRSSTVVVHRDDMPRNMRKDLGVMTVEDKKRSFWASAAEAMWRWFGWKGAGDAFEAFTAATGVKAVFGLTEKVTGKPCGCKKRKEAMNRAMPFKRRGTEDEGVSIPPEVNDG